MPFCWEVDNDAGIVEGIPVIHKHSSNLHLAAFACGLIGRIVIGERLLKLESDAFTHYPNSVNGVNKCFSVRTEEITFCFVNHSVIPAPLDAYFRAASLYNFAHYFGDREIIYSDIRH